MSLKSDQQQQSLLSHDAEAAMASLARHHGVVGLILLDAEGRVVRESGDHDACARAGQAGLALASLGRSMVRDIDATDDLELLRCRSSGMELALVQGNDFTLVSVVLI